MSINGYYRLVEPTFGICCDLTDGRQCLTLPAGATIRPVHDVLDGSRIIHVKWGEYLITIFTQDFEKNATPISELDIAC